MVPTWFRVHRNTDSAWLARHTGEQWSHGAPVIYELARRESRKIEDIVEQTGSLLAEEWSDVSLFPIATAKPLGKPRLMLVTPARR